MKDTKEQARRRMIETILGGGVYGNSRAAGELADAILAALAAAGLVINTAPKPSMGAREAVARYFCGGRWDAGQHWRDEAFEEADDFIARMTAAGYPPTPPASPSPAADRPEPEQAG